MLFRNFSEVVPPKPVPASTPNGLNLQQIVGMKTPIFGGTAGESIEDRLAELQQDRTGNCFFSTTPVLFCKQQPHFAGRPKR